MIAEILERQGKLFLSLRGNPATALPADLEGMHLGPLKLSIRSLDPAPQTTVPARPWDCLILRLIEGKSQISFYIFLFSSGLGTLLILFSLVAPGTLPTPAEFLLRNKILFHWNHYRLYSSQCSRRTSLLPHLVPQLFRLVVPEDTSHSQPVSTQFPPSFGQTGDTFNCNSNALSKRKHSIIPEEHAQFRRVLSPLVGQGSL